MAVAGGALGRSTPKSPLAAPTAPAGRSATGPSRCLPGGEDAARRLGDVRCGSSSPFQVHRGPFRSRPGRAEVHHALHLGVRAKRPHAAHGQGQALGRLCGPAHCGGRRSAARCSRWQQGVSEAAERRGKRCSAHSRAAPVRRLGGCPPARGRGLPEGPHGQRDCQRWRHGVRSSRSLKGCGRLSLRLAALLVCSLLASEARSARRYCRGPGRRRPRRCCRGPGRRRPRRCCRGPGPRRPRGRTPQVDGRQAALPLPLLAKVPGLGTGLWWVTAPAAVGRLRCALVFEENHLHVLGATDARGL